MGHMVHELDPRAGTGFNVLDWIDTTSPLAATNINSVVAWVCGDTKPAARKDDFFDSMARNVVRCFLAHILFDRDSAGKAQDLARGTPGDRYAGQ